MEGPGLNRAKLELYTYIERLVGIYGITWNDEKPLYEFSQEVINEALRIEEEL